MTLLVTSNWNDSQPGTAVDGLAVYLDTESLKWMAINDVRSTEAVLL